MAKFLGGYAAHMVFIEGSNATNEIIKGGEEMTTNNRMELLAVIKALDNIKNRKSEINIIIDSKYVKDGINQWIINWKKNGWKTAKKKPVLNKDLWLLLDKHTTELSIKWQWVKGHSGNPINELVDKIAYQQALSFKIKRKRDEEDAVDDVDGLPLKKNKSE
jgi:ribonuclease HI